jgi:predicted enzyme related to lactoylglutathione lyase
MNPHIGFVTLGVGDLNRAKQFYSEGLGWPVQVARASTSPSSRPTAPPR